MPACPWCGSHCVRTDGLGFFRCDDDQTHNWREVKVMRGRFGEVSESDEVYLRAILEAYLLAPVDGWAESRLLHVLEEESNRHGVDLGADALKRNLTEPDDFAPPQSLNDAMAEVSRG